MTQGDTVTIVEVSPRDGFQPIAEWIPTERKISLIHAMRQAGLTRIEITSFANAKAVPQLRDAAEIVIGCATIPGLLPQVLVPTRSHALRAVEAGAQRLAYVLSASDAHNRSNVRRATAESLDDLNQLLASEAGRFVVRINIATAFDCPFEGRVDARKVTDILARLGPLPAGCEICLCDTTGRADPEQVGSVLAVAMSVAPAIETWAFHAHDTYGLGTANCYAAYRAGLRIFDSSAGGLGGCPFAPGATGNVATEDLAWMFERMGVATGIDLDALLDISTEVAALPGALPGGRVRQAFLAARSRPSRG